MDNQCNHIVYKFVQRNIKKGVGSISKYINKTIIHEREVNIKGVPHKKVTYEDGEIIYKRYDDKGKIWIVKRFSTDNNTNVLEELNKICTEIYFNTV